MGIEQWVAQRLGRVWAEVVSLGKPETLGPLTKLEMYILKSCKVLTEEWFWVTHKLRYNKSTDKHECHVYVVMKGVDCIISMSESEAEDIDRALEGLVSYGYLRRQKVEWSRDSTDYKVTKLGKQMIGSLEVSVEDRIDIEAPVKLEPLFRAVDRINAEKARREYDERLKKPS